MADGSYEEGSGVPQVNGYVSGLLEDELGGMAFMPSAVNGSDSTYLCDYWYAPTGDRILLAGAFGSMAGVRVRLSGCAWRGLDFRSLHWRPASSSGSLKRHKEV